MCSIGDDNVEEDNSKHMEKKVIDLTNSKCNKCGSHEIKVVLRHIHAYCKNCFLAAVSHKFKATLGKHRLINPDDHVLVYHNGGHASSALLHLLHTSVNENNPKKLRCIPHVLIIECYYDVEIEERKNVLKKLHSEATLYGFPTYFISLAQYIHDASKASATKNIDSFYISTDEDINFIKQTNATNYQSLLDIYKQRLLIDVAKQLDCKCAITTEIATDIACQLLTNVSLGRGSQIPLDTGVCDKRDSKVQIVRPLRLFDIKELAFYNIFYNLDPVVYSTQQKPAMNVQNLMSSFIGNLQENFPATVTTIVRTGDKLVVDKNLQQKDVCVLCKVPKENENIELNSAECTNFSRWISTHSFSDSVENFNNSTNQKYCYSCSRITDYINKVT